jgi:hypothetical protein
VAGISVTNADDIICLARSQSFATQALLGVAEGAPAQKSLASHA